MNYAHMCRDGHEEIGHSDNEHELCPLCRSMAACDQLNRENADLKGRLEDMQTKARKILEHSWGLPFNMVDVLEEIAGLLEFDPDDPKKITDRQYQITLEDVMAALDGCDMDDERLLVSEVQTAVEFRKLLDETREDRRGWESAYFHLKGEKR